MDLQEEGIGFVAISQALAENGIAAARFLRMDKWIGMIFACNERKRICPAWNSLPDRSLLPDHA